MQRRVPGLGEQPLVRSIGKKKAALTGKDNLMWDAIAAHSGATLSLLPTGHVTVLGGEEATASELLTGLPKFCDLPAFNSEVAPPALSSGTPLTRVNLFDCALSGTTATLAVHRKVKGEETLIVAHVGDSRAVQPADRKSVV